MVACRQRAELKPAAPHQVAAVSRPDATVMPIAAAVLSAQAALARMVAGTWPATASQGRPWGLSSAFIRAAGGLSAMVSPQVSGGVSAGQEGVSGLRRQRGCRG